MRTGLNLIEQDSVRTTLNTLLDEATVIAVKLLQEENAELSMLVTPRRELSRSSGHYQDSKADIPMLVTLEGIVTLAKLLQARKV